MTQLSFFFRRRRWVISFFFIILGEASKIKLFKILTSEIHFGTECGCLVLDFLWISRKLLSQLWLATMLWTYYLRVILEFYRRFGLVIWVIFFRFATAFFLFFLWLGQWYFGRGASESKQAPISFMVNDLFIVIILKKLISLLFTVKLYNLLHLFYHIIQRLPCIFTRVISPLYFQ